MLRPTAKDSPKALTSGPPDAPPSSELPEAQEQPVLLLSQALERHRAHDLSGALILFRAALATQSLSPAGQILAYWHLWSEEEAMHHDALAMEALAGFIATAEDLTEIQPADSIHQEAIEEFATRFALAHKLAYARAAQSVTWAQKHADFGRSRSHPIVVRSQAELSAYLLLLPHCAQDTPWRVLDQDVALGTPQRGLLWVRLSCGENPIPLDLFFEHHAAHKEHVSERDGQYDLAKRTR